MYTLDDEYNYIDNIKKELKFLTNSKVRLKLLICLYDSELTVKELHEKTNLNYSSITNNLNKLEEFEYINKNNEKYTLTTSTKMKLVNLLYFNNNLDFIYEYVDFINNHQVENDNIDSLATLPYVNIDNSQLIQADNINPFLATETIEQTMMREGLVKAICIYLHPNCSDMIAFMMNQKSEFEVIVPLDFAQYIIQHANNYKTDKPLENICFNIKPLRKIPLNIALVVSENEIVVGLVKKDSGLLNKNCVLRSEDENARRWGLRVFREYESLKPGYIDIRELISKNNNLE